MKRPFLVLLMLAALGCDSGPRSIFEDPCGKEQQGYATHTKDGRLVCHPVRPAPPPPDDDCKGKCDDEGGDVHAPPYDPHDKDDPRHGGKK